MLAFLGSPFGLFWLLSGGVLLFGMPLVDRYRSAQRRGNDLQEQLAAMTAALEQLPAQIEQAVATAVATIEPVVVQAAADPAVRPGLAVHAPADAGPDVGLRPPGGASDRPAAPAGRSARSRAAGTRFPPA